MGIINIFQSLLSGDGVKDPVCGMKINLEKTANRINYRGKDYGFCSEGCQNEFERKPSAYI